MQKNAIAKGGLTVPFPILRVLVCYISRNDTTVLIQINLCTQIARELNPSTTGCEFEIRKFDPFSRALFIAPTIYLFELV